MSTETLGCRTELKLRSTEPLPSLPLNPNSPTFQTQNPMYLSSTLLCYKPYSPQALNTRHNRKPLSSLETVTPLNPKFKFPPTIKTPKLSSLPGPRRRCRWEMGGSNLCSQSSEHLTGRLGGLPCLARRRLFTPGFRIYRGFLFCGGFRKKRTFMRVLSKGLQKGFTRCSFTRFFVVFKLKAGSTAL